MPRLFQKGQSGNPAGRVPGTRNKATLEIKEIARALIEDPEYVKSLRTRLIAGTAQAMEQTLFYFAYGKPVDRVAPVNPDGSAYAPGQDAEELIGLIADLRIWLGRLDESEPDGSGPH